MSGWMGRLAALALVLVLAACGRQDDPPAAARPVSAQELADIGRLAFFDPGLSASGRQSCASCHSPEHAYGPPNSLAVQLGGPDMKHPGTRAVPSLRYLRRTPIWSHAIPVSMKERLSEPDLKPSGGFAWDGRFNSMADQAAFPLLNPDEMANADAAAVAARLAKAAYAERFRQAFGRDILSRPDRALAALGKALERFELDDPSFQPFSSKFDRYLDGKVRLDAQEQRGFALFVDPARGNCASCHLAAMGGAGAHPVFTDFNFQVVGVPRNPEIPANADPAYYDLGLCGPVRGDQSAQRKYCGMFKTPSLRNVASRGAFFHNGRFHDLTEVLRFYVERNTAPGKWYPHPGGRQRYDDLPPDLQGNVDFLNAPFDTPSGGKPVWSEADIASVAAFLRTLTDQDVLPVDDAPGERSKRRLARSE
ncbi:cytochrome c peroxidase [Pigmentiphaga soli]|uniref:Cytochrome c peroxidase n=1 Tax=Pigmentiphaga soli TaxID=1007095 RepID=A0ABP8GZV9_9BURK